MPPYHLEVLRAAGVPATAFNPSSDITAGPMVVLCTLLPEFKSHLKQLPQAATGPHTTSASATATGSSSIAGTSGSSSTTGSGSSAAVVALLAPCSLVWGEFLALRMGTCSARETAMGHTAVGGMVVDLWHISWKAHFVAQSEAAGQVDDSSGVVEMQEEPQQQEQQQQPVVLPLMPPVSQQNAYRSCVELIVPSLLHMRAAHTADAAEYATVAAFCFEQLELLLLACLTEGGGELNKARLRLLKSSSVDPNAVYRDRQLASQHMLCSCISLCQM